jgi:hypothetical protein
VLAAEVERLAMEEEEAQTSKLTGDQVEASPSPTCEGSFFSMSAASTPQRHATHQEGSQKEELDRDVRTGSWRRPGQGMAPGQTGAAKHTTEPGRSSTPHRRPRRSGHDRGDAPLYLQ